MVNCSAGLLTEVAMKTEAMTTVLATAMMLAGAAMAENIGSTVPGYVGLITGDAEKNTFGYVVTKRVEQPRAVTLSQEAQYIGRRVDDEERDTFAFLEMRPKLSAELTK
jgi:uncharacterized protein YdbL (DUF1318 family)